MTTAAVRRPELPGLLPASLAGSSAGAARRSGRDWFVDVLCFLIAASFVVNYGFEMISGADPVPDAMMVADIAAGVLATIGLWWRRRWPVAFALALLPVGLYADTASGASLIAVFTVAVHRRAAIALGVGALHMLSCMPYLAIRPDPQLPYWTVLVIVWLVIAATVAWGMFVRARRQLILSLRDRAEQAEAEQELRVQQARQVERTRIAREMHDVLAHRISLLSLHAGALEFRPDAPSDEVAKAAGVIRSSAHQALHDLREVIGVLRDDPAADAPVPPQPTLDDLPALVDESRQAGMRIRLHDEVRREAEPPTSVGRSAYRVTQEALTNARKHAPGTAVEVTVGGGPGDGLTVEVRNPWPVGGPSGIPGAGTGLVGLAERVQLAGGRLAHGRTPDGSFRVHAWLPWPA
ncbi:sensor histidine kinase [Spirilliplanes yamanashiensis]|uniref:sensor histidine kinase n=1 Tax=Spirilliplanes yamanashiensis TaxID=42233 RepID=UPI00194E07A7|nr:histidine kinase [Spirilliplanes yamanashiensis]